MTGAEPAEPQVWTYVWRLGVTMAFVLLNGFFVAAEFALVKMRASRVEALAAEGGRRARTVQHVYQNLDHYLSACQLGITVASLVLGWLAEPAVAELLLAAAAGLGIEVGQGPWVHAIALAIALSIVTILHMVIGEQAPKMWAIHRSEATTLQTAEPLRMFAFLFAPLIWLINTLSNSLLRAMGLSAGEHGEAVHTVEELRAILLTSTRAGHISERQRELTENVLRLVGMEVRHILVPRVDAVALSLQNPLEENLRIIRESGHSRFPLCRTGLDTVIGIVHVKSLLTAQQEGRALDLEALATPPLLVSEIKPLSTFIVRMQSTRNHMAVVIDERGTALGLAFLEDALEEIVGPIADEFDEPVHRVERGPEGMLVMPGSLALPEAAALLELPESGAAADTIGGRVVAELGRLPRAGDQLDLGRYRVTVLEVARRRVGRLRFEPRES